MTTQEKKLLKKLITAQITEDRSVYVNSLTLKAVTVHCDDETYKEVSLSEFKDNLQSVLRQLETKGYITRKRWNVTVEHPGFHTTQAAFQSFLSSVLLPIIISAVTSLVTALITVWVTSLSA